VSGGVTDTGTGRPPWAQRRRIVHLTLVFCATCVAYALVKGEDTELARAIVNGAFLLAGSVIASYVFGAVWDDKNIMTAYGRDAYADMMPASATQENRGGG
jgi:DMSO reductase anchor subunit